MRQTAVQLLRAAAARQLLAQAQGATVNMLAVKSGCQGGRANVNVGQRRHSEFREHPHRLARARAAAAAEKEQEQHLLRARLMAVTRNVRGASESPARLLYLC